MVMIEKNEQQQKNFDSNFKKYFQSKVLFCVFCHNNNHHNLEKNIISVDYPFPLISIGCSSETGKAFLSFFLSVEKNTENKMLFLFIEQN